MLECYFCKEYLGGSEEYETQSGESICIDCKDQLCDTCENSIADTVDLTTEVQTCVHCNERAE